MKTPSKAPRRNSLPADPNEGPYSSADPRAQLPALETIPQMGDELQHAALAKWVSWFNGHRSIVPVRLERQLDDVLHDLDRREVAAARGDLRRLQVDFDDWLESLPWE